MCVLTLISAVCFVGNLYYGDLLLLLLNAGYFASNAGLTYFVWMMRKEFG